MPKVNFVKSARKDNPVAKVGEPYYWWQFKFGGKHYSKTPPKPSQLTQSEFMKFVYYMQDRIETLAGYENAEDLKAEIDSIVDEIRSQADELDEKFNNMPEGFQQGDTGTLLEERRDAMNQWADDLENIDIIFDPDETAQDPEFAFTEWLEQVLTEIQSTDPGV